jgi:hypothetical protein
MKKHGNSFLILLPILLLVAGTVMAEHKPGHSNSNAGGLPAALAELAQCNAALAQTEAELGAANARVAALTAQVADLSSSLATAEESLADCQTSLVTTQAQLTVALEQVAALVGQNTDLLAENAGLASDLAICDEGLDQCQTAAVSCPCNFEYGLTISDGIPVSCEVAFTENEAGNRVGMSVYFTTEFFPLIGMGANFRPSWLAFPGGPVGACRESDNPGPSGARLIYSVAQFGKCLDDLLTLAEKPVAEGGMGLTCTFPPE